MTIKRGIAFKWRIRRIDGKDYAPIAAYKQKSVAKEMAKIFRREEKTVVRIFKEKDRWVLYTD